MKCCLVKGKTRTYLHIIMKLIIVSEVVSLALLVQGDGHKGGGDYDYDYGGHGHGHGSKDCDPNDPALYADGDWKSETAKKNGIWKCEEDVCNLIPFEGLACKGGDAKCHKRGYKALEDVINSNFD